MFSVYGIRLRGDTEARYIGQTYRSGDFRLACHLTEARSMPGPTAFALWLIAHADHIEAFEIVAVATREEAKRREREAVEVCLALNHRLFNRHLVPADRRIPKRNDQRKSHFARCAA